MKGTDRYSKSTNKKAIDTENDPYLSKLGAEGVGMCKECSAVYELKRWRLATEEDLSKEGSFESVTCPACRKIKDNYVGGYVTLKGQFLKEHKEEFLNLIKNKEERAIRINPLERIIKIKDMGDLVEITTTTEKFAQMLGRVIHKAFSGEVEYKWSDDVKCARVTWER